MSQLTEHVRKLIGEVQNAKILPSSGEKGLQDIIEEIEIIIRNAFSMNSPYMRKLILINNLAESDKYKRMSEEIATRERKGFLGGLRQVFDGAGFVGALHLEKKAELEELLNSMLRELKLKDMGLF